ncbi:MAG: tetratricopeptide repeat protein, partial [Rhodospirillales bacterium]|nr:tetratricopeptide repeat protein [Rhodospirillales bacterium]
MYAEGEGVPQDYKTAVKWYRLAAEQGFAVAQSKLGWMYAEGQGVPQDYTLAHMWWNVAASQGDKHAKNNRDKVEKEMSPTQIETAKRLARECEKKKYKGCGKPWWKFW